MRPRVFTVSLALTILVAAGLVGFAQPAKADSKCEQVSGEFAFTSFAFTSATTAVGEGTVTGDLAGTFHADYFDIQQRGGGVIHMHGEHTIRTAAGTLVT
jgi:hypothetical protein